jgi:drug/metabolite transporter (DMT)-like permease
VNKIPGVFWAALSALFFSAGTLLIKAMGPGVPFFWVAFMRNLAPLPLLLLLMRNRGLAVPSPNWKSLLSRGVWGACAIACLSWALPRMPLADAILLGHASPLYSAAFGVFFFAETLDGRAFACLAVAFAGVLVTLRPGLHFDSVPYFAALASGLLSSLAHVTVKSLSKSEPSTRIVLYSATAGALLFIQPVLTSGFSPSPLQWGLMVLVGLTITAGQLLLTGGIARAPVSTATAGLFMTIVMNIAGGWLFWGEVPDPWSWLGSLLILGGIAGLGLGRR